MQFESALKDIAGRAEEYDLGMNWPFADLAQLQHTGAMRWAIPIENGGLGLAPFELHLRYEQLAAASVSTALILTQRDAAAGLIEAADGAAPNELAQPSGKK